MCERATTYFLGAVRGWSTSSWRSWVQRLGGAIGGMLYVGVAALRVTLAIPQVQFFLWWGRRRSVGTALRYAIVFQDAAVVGPLRMPLEAGTRGGGSGSSHTWIFGLPICSAQKLSPCPQLCSIPPPCWRPCLTPSPQNGSSRGGVSRHDKRLGHPSAPPPRPTSPPPPPSSRGTGDLLPSIPVTARGPRGRGGGDWVQHEGGQSAFTPGPRTRPSAPRPEFHGRKREEGSTGSRPAKRPILYFRARGRTLGVLGSALRL